MKKSFMTRILATGLSFAMAFSMAAATNVTPASAASKPVLVDAVTGGSGRAVTVNVGEVAKLKVNAATSKTYAVSSVKKSSKKIKTAVNKKGTVVYVRGVAETGEKDSAIRVSFKVKKTGKISKFTFASKVKVVAAEPVVTQSITSVTQKSFTTLEVVFQTALEKIDGTFTLTRVNDNQDIQIKASDLDTTDKTKVTLTTYVSLTDGKEYNVKYTANDEAKTVYEKTVTVSDGTVADVAITPVEVTVNEATEIKYQTLDANGLVLSEKNIKKNDSNIEVSWTSTLGTLDEGTGKLTLYNVGDTATFTVTYHTYKYDTQGTGAEIGAIKKDFVVTGVKNATVVSQYNYTIAKEKPYSWSKVTPVTTLGEKDGSGNGDAQRYAYFQIKDSNGKDITSTCEYTVESSDNSIVVADGFVKDGVDLVPVAKGSAYLMIKDKDGKVVDTKPITVGDKRKVSSIRLSTNSVSVASNAAVDDLYACAYIKVTAKDQYGEDIGSISSVDIKTDNSACDAAAIDDQWIKIAANGDGHSATVGKTDTYEVTVKDNNDGSMSQRFTATCVKDTQAEPSLSVVFTDDQKIVNSVDTTVSESSKRDSAELNVTANVVEVKNGVVVGKAGATKTTAVLREVSLIKNDGTVLAKTTTGSATITSSAAVDASKFGSNKIATKAAIGDQFDKLVMAVVSGAASTTNPFEKNLGVGSYTVRYKVDGYKNDAVATLKVEDSQTAVSIKVKETNTGSNTDLKSFLSTLDNAEFYYGDVYLGQSDITIDKVNYVVNHGKHNAYVKSVDVTVLSANNNADSLNGAQYYKVNVPVNKTFTTSGEYPNS